MRIFFGQLQCSMFSLKRWRLWGFSFDNFNAQSDFYAEYTEIISLIIGVAWMTMHTGSDVSKIVTRGLCPELYLPHAGIYAEQLRSKYKRRFLWSWWGGVFVSFDICQKRWSFWFCHIWLTRKANARSSLIMIGVQSLDRASHTQKVKILDFSDQASEFSGYFKNPSERLKSGTNLTAEV